MRSLNLQSMHKRLNSNQIRKARKARQIGKKVLEMKWNGTRLVKGNMTFYFDNVLIQTKNTYPFDEIVLYIELDGTRCRENIEVLMGGASEYKRKHLEKRMLDRVLSPEEIEKVVREGLTVLDCRSLDGRPGVHYNTYYYMDDKCVVGTVINKGHTVVVNTAYRITPVGDIGFLSDQVNWLIKRIGYKSSISRCYVIDRTASGEYAQNELVRMIPGILSSVASLSPGERKAWSQNETIRHIMDQAQKLKASLNVVPWDSQNDQGTSFKTCPDHDYSFVVEVDNNENVYADAQKRLKDFGLDTDLYRWSSCVLPNPSEYSQAFMFDLRDYSGDDHIWAKTRTRRPNSHATNNKSS